MELPCEYRGDRLGKLYCGCQGAPDVFVCSNEHVTSQLCMLHARTYRRREIDLAGGGRREFEGKPGVCAACRHRESSHPHLRELRSEDLEWISTSQLVEDGLKLIQYVEPDTTGVIGVPRSGMIPAAAVATHCHLPLYELTGMGIRQMAAGSRGRNWIVPAGRPKFLLIDDSSHNGGAMNRARTILREHDVTYAAVYTLTPYTVDVYARLLDKVHIFDWNILNNGIVEGRAIDPRLRGEGFMLDFDGILCPDPDRWHTDADEKAVQKWLRDVRPMRWIPRLCRIPYIVSFRLEKHRPIIQKWLRQWRIPVDRLILHPAKTFAERDANFDVIEHKARRFKESGCSIFIESCPQQARVIADHSSKPVLCPSAKTFFFGGEG
jgi:hypothetical protein